MIRPRHIDRFRSFRIAGILAILLGGIACDRASPPDGPVQKEAAAPAPQSRPDSLTRRDVAPPVRPRGPSPIRFREITDGCGIDFEHVSGNSSEKDYPTANGSGVALLDYDGDGRLDIYLATTRSFPLDAPTTARGNRLYRNHGDGTFEDVTDRAGIGYRGFCQGVAAADVDNDGDTDLFLANFGPDVLYRNNGDGTFQEVSGCFPGGSPPWSSGAAFLDYDGDGLLDLYVTCYGKWAEGGTHPTCGDPAKGLRTYCSPMQMTPTRHYLYRNRGNGRFEDVTERAGVLRRDGRGLGIIAADLDLDGRIDLYVANDMCQNFLYINRGDGTFEDLTETSGAAATEAGYRQASMGVDAEDLTGDGFPELFVTNFENDYNTLYRNLDGRSFQDVSTSSGIVKDSLPYVGWGCAWPTWTMTATPTSWSSMATSTTTCRSLAARSRRPSPPSSGGTVAGGGSGSFRIPARSSRRTTSPGARRSETWTTTGTSTWSSAGWTHARRCS